MASLLALRRRSRQALWVLVLLGGVLRATTPAGAYSILPKLPVFQAVHRFEYRHLRPMARFYAKEWCSATMRTSIDQISW
jgi:hypothetical protein